MNAIIKHNSDLISIQYLSLGIWLKLNLNEFIKDGCFIYLSLSFRDYYLEDFKINSKLLYHKKDLHYLYLIDLNKNYEKSIQDIISGFTEFQSSTLIISKNQLIGEWYESQFRKTSKTLAQIFEGFVLYKGVEQNVLWIAKNSNIKFPNIN